MKKFISLLISFVMAFSCLSTLSVMSSAKASDDKLRFGSDGKFKIVVFADTQDTENPNQTMIDFMGYALDSEQPDLVVFTGDNVVESSKAKFKTGAEKLLKPIVDRNLPYAYTFGNHDAEKVDKEYMHSVYKSLGNCLTYNADDSISGYGNCNIPIYGSNSDEMKFNLWMIDSNMYGAGGIFDNVHEDQIEWFLKADKALEASVGHKVDSLVFQHIAVPEIYNCIESGLGKLYQGKSYKLKLKSNAKGTLGEFPCSPNKNSGEFDALKSRGDVIGIVTGHDHKNSFVGTHEGIDFIQFPGMTFHSYGSDNVRGFGVIELSESNTRTYKSKTVRYIDGGVNINMGERTDFDNEYYRYTSGIYISEIKCSAAITESKAKSKLSDDGYIFINFDLNEGGGGQYVYMGYKTTINPDEAIKDLCFYSSKDDFTWDKMTVLINGNRCEYICDKSADLNKGSSGDYIYACYSKDSRAGSPISAISFSKDISAEKGAVCGGVIDHKTPADLNKGSTKHSNAIYCYVERDNQIVTSQVTKIRDKFNALSKYLENSNFNDSSTTDFALKMSNAQSFLKDIDSTHYTRFSYDQIERICTDMMDSCAMLMTGSTDGKHIFGVPSATDPYSIISSFSDYVTVNVEPTGKYLGTNSKIKLYYEDRVKVLSTVTFGDINGDGWYDGQDALLISCIKNGMIEKTNDNSALFEAADCNHDGIITDKDINLVSDAGLLLDNIDRTKSNDELLATSSAYNEYVQIIDQYPEVELIASDEPIEEPLTDEVTPSDEVVPSKEEIDPGFSVSFLDRLLDFFTAIVEKLFSVIIGLYK